MKFRALNFDYHAEATLRREQQQQQKLRGSDAESDKPSFRLLIQAGSYETDQKEAPAAANNHERRNWPTKEESISPFSVVDELSFTRNAVVERIIRSKKDTVVSNDACTSPAAVPDITINDKEDIEIEETSHFYMEIPKQHPATLQTPQGDSVVLSRASVSILKTKRVSNMLTVAELMRVCSTIQRETRSLRLANEPWCDDIRKNSRPKETPKLPLRRDPEHFSPTATTRIAEDLLDRACFNVTWVGPARMEAVVAALGHHVGLSSIRRSNPMEVAPPYSFSLLGLLRGGIASSSFGMLRRVNQAACVAKLRIERSAIVPYTGPRTPQQLHAPAAAAAASHYYTMLWAVQLAMAALQHKVKVPKASCSNATFVITDTAFQADENRSQDAGFSQYLHNRDEKCRGDTATILETGLPWRSNVSMERTSQVSFADFVKSRHFQKKVPPQQTDQQQEEITSKPAAKRNRPDHRSGDQQQDVAEPIHKMPKSELTSEAKEARKKARKVLKKEKRREEKKRKRSKSTDKVDEPSKTAKTKTDSGVQTKALPRSVVPKSSVRRLMLSSVDDELDKTRSTLKNTSHERRKAFSQMKLHCATTPTKSTHQPHGQHPSAPQLFLRPGHFSETFQVKHPSQNPANMTTNTVTQRNIQGPPQPTGNFQGRPLPAPQFPSNAQLQRLSQPHPFAQVLEMAPAQQNEVGISYAHKKGRSLRPTSTSHVQGQPSVSNRGTAAQHRPGCLPSSCKTAPQLPQSAQLPRMPPQHAMEMTHGQPGNTYQQQAQVKDATDHHQKTSAENHFQKYEVPRKSAYSEPTQQPDGHLPKESEATAIQKPDASLLPPVMLLCSEDFIESWGEVVAELASGRWANKRVDNGGKMEIPLRSSSSNGRKISLIDTPLVNVCGVDIEASGRSGFLVFAASELESVMEAKQIVLDVAELVAVGRYSQLYIFLCYNIEISPAIAKHIVQLQCAVASTNGLPPTKVAFKTTTPHSLSASLAHTILSRPKLSPEERLNKQASIEAATDTRIQERSHFLLSLLPVLSLNGAIQCLLLAKKLLPAESPYFELLFKNQRLRQQIMLTATSGEKGAEVHPSAMVQLSRVLRVFINKGSQIP